MKLFDTLRRHRRYLRAAEAASAGRVEDALAALDEILAEEPGNADALKLLAQLRFAANDLDAAEETSRRYLELVPDDADAKERLRQIVIQQAFAARDNERNDRAIERLRAALELDPDDPFIHYNMGNVHAETPDGMMVALECWQRAVSLRPDYIEPRFDLAQVFVFNSRYSEAVPHLEAIIRSRPDWPAPFYLLAVCHIKRGDADAALACLQTAVLINTSWGKTAVNDVNFAPLRGNPEFDALEDAVAVVRVDELTRVDDTTPRNPSE